MQHWERFCIISFIYTILKQPTHQFSLNWSLLLHFILYSNHSFNCHWNSNRNGFSLGGRSLKMNILYSCGSIRVLHLMKEAFSKSSVLRLESILDGQMGVLWMTSGQWKVVTCQKLHAANSILWYTISLIWRLAVYYIRCNTFFRCNSFLLYSRQGSIS